MNNNKLIAEFMGWDIKSPTSMPRNLHLSNLELDNGEVWAYKFHTSWDWLMPVVEKIECTHDDKGDCFNVMMEAFECTISGLGLTLCLNGHTKMDATYKAIVEFIKQYNNEKN